MLDKLMTRVFGSYKSTVEGLVASSAMLAADYFVTSGGTWDNRKFAIYALPAVLGAWRKDAPKG